MAPRAITRLRKLCLALPEAHEVIAWGEPTFRVRNKMFAAYAAANTHHGGGRHAVWLKAVAVNQAFMVRDASDRYFVPPYVGPSGWIGVWLDEVADWKEVAALIEDAYRLIAPRKLLRMLDPQAPAFAKPTRARSSGLTGVSRRSPGRPKSKNRGRRAGARENP